MPRKNATRPAALSLPAAPAQDLDGRPLPGEAQEASPGPAAPALVGALPAPAAAAQGAPGRALASVKVPGRRLYRLDCWLNSNGRSHAPGDVVSLSEVEAGPLLGSGMLIPVEG